MKTLLSIAVVAVVLVVQPFGPRVAWSQSEDRSRGSPGKSTAASGLTPPQRAILARGERHEKSGWIYLHIEGEPRARGFQHGYLLAKEIRQSLRAMSESWKYESGMEWPWLVKKAKGMLLPKVDAEDLVEIDGMVEGLAAARVSTSPEELIAYNGIIELSAYWWPLEKDKTEQGSTPQKKSCSAFIATGGMTADGRIVLGHNTMTGYASADCYVVLDVQPAKGHRILMQSVPGWIHSGTDFFITDAGLVGAETTIGGFKGFDAKGIPEFVRFRRATQDASSIDQWCEIMKRGNNGGYANAWLLGDINTNEIARLELGLKHVALEKKRDGFFIGSNVAEDLKLLRLETKVRDTDIRVSSVARRVRWKQLMREHAGKIDLDLAKQFEADHYDSFLRKDYPGARSLCDHSERDELAFNTDVPFSPSGTVDGKVVDAKMAREMSFAARWGSACGMAFDAEKFLADHPQFDWMKGIVRSRPSQPWANFQAGEKGPNP